MQAVRTEIIAQRGSFLHLYAIQIDPRSDHNEAFFVLSRGFESAEDIFDAAGFDTSDKDNDGLPVILDGWGRPIRVELSDGAGIYYLIYSVGPDGQAGTDDDIRSDEIN